MTDYHDDPKPQVTAYDRRRPSMLPTEASALIENPLQVSCPPSHRLWLTQAYH